MGSYHTTDANQTYYTSEEWAALEGTKPNPRGDVTNEEIDYVSRWFRTHREPKDTEVTIAWHDYFLQEISADCDREVTPDGTSCDTKVRIEDCPLYSQYDGFYYTPDPLPQSLINSWTPAGTRHLDYGMDKLIIKLANRQEEWDPTHLFGDGDEGWEDWEHVLNFNGGSETNYYGNYEDPNSFPFAEMKDRTIQLYVGSGTADFSYLNSTQGKRFRQYTIQHLVFDIPQKGVCEIHKRNCTNHHYDGYYLGFDFETFILGSDSENENGGNANESEAMAIDDEGEEGDTQTPVQNKLGYKPRDGFYSNWILKISEGTDKDGNKPSDYPKIKTVEQGLLVCEDLGDYDYDFNDVVLRLQHVKYTADANATPVDRLRVTAMAAGGTLPSNIYYIPDGDVSKEVEMKVDGSSEIHTLLNGEAPQIINAAPEFRGAGKTWISDDITVPAEAEDAFASYVFDNGWIKIVVDDGKNGGAGTVVQRPIKSGYHDDEANDFAENTAPQMMFLPITYLWPQEEVFIGDAYTDFKSWVQDKDNTDWYTRPQEDLVTWRSVSTGSGSGGSAAGKPNRTIITTIMYNQDNLVEPGSDSAFELEVDANKGTFNIVIYNQTEEENATSTERYDVTNSNPDVISVQKSGNVEDNTYGKGVKFEVSTKGYSGEVVLKFTIDGYTYVTVTITLTGGSQPGEGGNESVDYEALYGEPLTEYAITTGDLEDTGGIYNNPQMLIETSKFPSSGNVTITFVVSAQWGNFLGYKKNEDGAQPMWKEEQLTVGVQSTQIPGDTNTAVQWTGDVTDLTDYQYLGCATGDAVIGVYVQTNGAPAKKRTARRR